MRREIVHGSHVRGHNQTMKQYLRDLVQILAIGAAFATIPLFAALAKLEPPWPPAMAYVSSALVLMSALVAWEWTRATHRKLRRTWIVVSLSGALLGLAAYLVAYSSFVEVNPDGGERVVRGFTCTRDAQLVYRERCPDLTARELRQAEWDPSALWTSQSITTARISLALAWLVFMAGLVGRTV